jgi:3-hydroxybutyryl-CoA dehydratase
VSQKPYTEYTLDEQFESYARTVTEADLVNYTGLAGLKLPMFIDEEFSKKHSLYGTRVMPGLFTASIAAGMLEDVLGKYTLAALGLDNFVFSHPVRIGDTLSSKVTVIGKKDVKQGARGVLTVRVEVLNQEKRSVCSFQGAFMMRIDVNL